MKRILKLILSIILSCVFTYPAHSQSAKNSYIIKRDSLSQLIQSDPKENIDRVVNLNQYARLCFYTHDFQKGFVAMYEARELSEKLDHREGLTMYYLTLSSFHTNEDLRMYYRKKAQWSTNLLDDQLDRYDLYTELPGYNFGNDFSFLLNEFNTSLKHFQNLGDIEIQANIMAGISYTYLLKGDLEELFENNEKMKVLFAEIQEIYPVFLISIYRMNELIRNNKIEEAREIELELIQLIAQRKSDNILGLIASTMATNYRERGRWVLAIEYYLKSLEVLNQSDDPELVTRIHFYLGLSYENLGMNSKAADAYLNSIVLVENLEDTTNLYNAYGTLVFPLIALQKYDEAQKYMELALHDTITVNSTYVLGRYKDAQAQMLRDQGKYAEAIPVFNEAFELFDQLEYNRWAAPFIKLYLAECYLKINDYEMALREGLNCLQLETAMHAENTIVKRKISLLLSEIYDAMGNQELAYKYLRMYQTIRSESDEQDEANRVADAEVRSIIEKSQKEIEELEQEKLRREQQSKIQRLWIFSIAGAFLSAIVLSLVLYRNNQNKQKANIILKEQKEEIESTLEKLEATQSQLIQSEKMASLGELTAGIAHEIRNPLNFVNNFSELNWELAEELREEIKNGNINEAEEIAKDIIENEKKIKHHGQRAEGIVKGMLQHSRTNAGEKESTDINALADEYLRLAFHGMRAKDNSFNAELQTDFDPNLPKIKVVQQDIGRVILNLINNAFYAVDKKSKEGLNGYKPLVTVSSKNVDDKIEIKIADNGPGIPENIKNKIFQPFFTTKPTGSGTGLGLSLSYDIVKSHGGSLSVESTENKGTEFKIQIPEKT